MLTKGLERQFDLVTPKNAKYTYFDFHYETRGDNFIALNELMASLGSLVTKFNYFCEERVSLKVVGLQKGVLRTNCLDCLDRTNVT